MNFAGNSFPQFNDDDKLRKQILKLQLFCIEEHYKQRSLVCNFNSLIPINYNWDLLLFLAKSYRLVCLSGTVSTFGGTQLACTVKEDWAQGIICIHYIGLHRSTTTPWRDMHSGYRLNLADFFLLQLGPRQFPAVDHDTFHA